MGNKNLNINPVFASTSLGATQTSVWYPIDQITAWSAQFTFTGTPSGTFSANVSNSPIDTPQGSIKGSVYANFNFVVSAAGDIYFETADFGGVWIQFVYTRTSSTGTLTSQNLVVKDK